jgi:hypothetical protein
LLPVVQVPEFVALSWFRELHKKKSDSRGIYVCRTPGRNLINLVDSFARKTTRCQTRTSAARIEGGGSPVGCLPRVWGWVRGRRRVPAGRPRSGRYRLSCPPSSAAGEPAVFKIRITSAKEYSNTIQNPHNMRKRVFKIPIICAKEYSKSA